MVQPILEIMLPTTPKRRRTESDPVGPIAIVSTLRPARQASKTIKLRDRQKQDALALRDEGEYLSSSPSPRRADSLRNRNLKLGRKLGRVPCSHRFSPIDQPSVGKCHKPALPVAIQPLQHNGRLAPSPVLRSPSVPSRRNSDVTDLWQLTQRRFGCADTIRRRAGE